MLKQIGSKNYVFGTFLILFSILIPSHVYAEKKGKFLCISEVAGGLVNKNGKWTSTEYKAGNKLVITILNNSLSSVKEFGGPDELAMTNCYPLLPSKSFACTSNFDMFRFQPSTRKFVYAQTAGFTNEFMEGGLKIDSNSFTPNISFGLCEPI